MESIYKPNSVSQWDNGYSSGLNFTIQFLQFTHPLCGQHRAIQFCSDWGLPGLISFLINRWSLTPPFHLFPIRQTADWMFTFCCTCRLPSTKNGGKPSSSEAPCPAEFGLSSPDILPEAAISPTSIILQLHPKIAIHYSLGM